MRIRRSLMAIAVFSLCAAATIPAVADPKPEDQVRQVLLNRNADLRAALLKAWISRPDASEASKIRSLTIDLYASEARLMALGQSRPMILDGAGISEVPYYVLAERSRIVLDPWAPFAGRTFAVGREAGR